MNTPSRPLTMLIAALGGEGGGVLTTWIINAAADAGLPAQSTSIPGVAQRTGATTYYIEVLPKPWRELAGRRPGDARTPRSRDTGRGVASERVGAARAGATRGGTPHRPVMSATTTRV